MRMLAVAVLIGAAAPVAGQPVPTAPNTGFPSEPAAAVAPDALPVAPGSEAAVPAPERAVFAEDDVLGAAEDVFGKGAEGLGEIVRKTFKSYGQPNAYIVGREVGGAFVVGLRYGSGTVHHKVEGERPVHWTGPSVGFDVGGDGSKVFALVYNLDDGEDLFRRYPAAEGKAYFIGGFAADFLQRDAVIIVPIKLGIGWRLGINAGYLKFTKKGDVNPF